MKNLYSNINGQLVLTTDTPIQSVVESVRSRYGIYETILLKEGHLLLSSLHWDRLWAGLKTLGFLVPDTWSPPFFERQIAALVHQNGLGKLCRIRLQIYSDSMERPLLPQFYIETWPLNEEQLQWSDNGLSIGVLNGFQKPIGPESNCKISHSKHYALAKAAMQQHVWDDVLLQNEKGLLIESAIANLFWVKDRVLYTPPLSDGCLAGTMRAWLLEIAARQQIPLLQESADKSTLLEADELWLSNSIRGIRWVAAFEGARYNNTMAKSLFHYWQQSTC